MDSAWAGLAAVPLLIAANAFFVIAEYALVAIRPTQVEQMRQGHGPLARIGDALAALKSDMPSALGAIQVCITLTNLLLGWLGEPAMSWLIARALAPLGAALPEAISSAFATALGFLIVTLLTVVLSELLPKALTLQYTQAMARLTALPILLIGRLLTPLVWLMNVMASGTSRLLGLGPVEIEGKPHTAEEIRAIAMEAHDAGVLTPRERSLILNSLGLGRRKAREIMVPRVRVSYLDLRWTMEQNLQVMGQYLFSRLPLCDGGMDHVVGLVYTKEFLTASQEATDDPMVLSLLARPAVFMPVTVSLDRLLAAFGERGSHLIFLVDEYGGVAGIVTLHDVVQELVGPMTDSGEQQRPPPRQANKHGGQSPPGPGAGTMR
jgi:CBS domain containing-hemolysin-like protein